MDKKVIWILRSLDKKVIWILRSLEKGYLDTWVTGQIRLFGYLGHWTKREFYPGWIKTIWVTG